MDNLLSNAYDGMQQLVKAERLMFPNSSAFFIMWRTLLAVFNIFVQMCYRSDVYRRNGRLFIPYNYNGKKYIISSSFNNGVIGSTYRVSDGESADVTNRVTQFMGPQFNFHDQRLTPEDLGYNKLTFTITDNVSDNIKTITFDGGDVMDLSKTD